MKDPWLADPLATCFLQNGRKNCKGSNVNLIMRMPTVIDRLVYSDRMHVTTLTATHSKVFSSQKEYIVLSIK